ncbi:activator of Hsp90 ATPase, putative [Plasmodium chabaudi chabaudi]|uniref:Activator of Hsp90 ATPase, putative n=1 Tax=Plasmodium chabaudi chabaudi TaxID=31271 RepID=A0A4V6M8X3_PLACU|nr:activator of Hsp90 ATPase, putative [Plasmodium chabaudi chabaudi]VTZ67202.1 activator of Hsp90 ATPase, putative [Plasmodium chabaudi chabaudi]|eukprot:XP_743083.2 activator of Hsp90 ATPase, putative [Plasmodium chabaudi chabaudi]
MSFEIQEEYYVPPEVLFNAFSDAYTLTRLSRGSLAEVDLKVGGKFTLFSGSISGEFVEIDKPNKIIQKWRFKDWNDSDYSKVTLEFVFIKENHTMLKLKHEHIPQTNRYNEGGILERCKSGWMENYLRNIEMVLGYPKKK